MTDAFNSAQSWELQFIIDLPRICDFDLIGVSSIEKAIVKANEFFMPLVEVVDKIINLWNILCQSLFSF